MSNYIPKPDLEYVNAPPSSPVRDLAFMGLGIILIIAIGLATFGWVGEWFFSSLSINAEHKLFSTFQGSLKKHAYQDPKLNEIFAKLTKKSNLPLEIGIICESSPNAFAVPGGAIAVTNGMFKKVNSEVGLAFVVAHEIGHFAHRHHLKGLGRGLGYTLGLLLLGIGDIETKLPNFLAQLMSRSYSREQETQADAYAMELVVSVYGHLNGATEFFDKIAAEELSLGVLNKINSTHPITEDRINAIRARQSDSSSLKQSPALTPLDIPNPCHE